MGTDDLVPIPKEAERKLMKLLGIHILSSREYNALLTTRCKEEVVVRLQVDQYNKLSGMLPKIAATDNPIEAGYHLGIQKVLEVLRTGWTIGI
jgi:predicted house-cleaning noncanonical NTP pyrophosphatase (MazG superfamily)